MKHVGAAALDRLEPLLIELRTFPGLRERNRGTFYRRSRAFLHFHEDGADLYADVRIDTHFERMRVTSAKEQAHLLRRIRTATKLP